MKQLCKILSLTAALLLGWRSLAPAQDIFVSNGGSGTIEKFDSAGTGSIFASGLADPAGLAFDSAGNLYVANTASGTIMKFNANGTGSVFASGLDSPSGLAFDGSGNLYVADLGTGTTGSGTIEKFDSAGTGSLFSSGLSFNGPSYLAFDGNYLFASTASAVQKFSAAGGSSTVFSCWNYVSGLAFDNTGNLFIGLQNAGSVVGINGGGITFDNPFAATPTGLAFDSAGSLYVSLGTEIEKFAAFGGHTDNVSEASGYVFASGLNGANFIAVDPAPEPETWAMAAAGLAVVLLRHRLRQSSSSRHR